MFLHLKGSRYVTGYVKQTTQCSNGLFSVAVHRVRAVMSYSCLKIAECRKSCWPVNFSIVVKHIIIERNDVHKEVKCYQFSCAGLSTFNALISIGWEPLSCALVFIHSPDRF